MCWGGALVPDAKTCRGKMLNPEPQPGRWCEPPRLSRYAGKPPVTHSKGCSRAPRDFVVAAEEIIPPRLNPVGSPWCDRAGSDTSRQRLMAQTSAFGGKKLTQRRLIVRIDAFSSSPCFSHDLVTFSEAYLTYFSTPGSDVWILRGFLFAFLEMH